MFQAFAKQKPGPSLLGGVHKLRLQEEKGRWSKKLIFFKLLYHRKCKRRGIGGQKKPNFVNVVCECPLLVKLFDGLKDIFLFTSQ